MNRRQLQNKADKIADKNGYTISVDMKKVGNLKMALRSLISDMEDGDFSGTDAIDLNEFHEDTSQCKECGQHYEGGHSCQQMVDKMKAMR